MVECYYLLSTSKLISKAIPNNFNWLKILQKNKVFCVYIINIPLENRNTLCNKQFAINYIL